VVNSGIVKTSKLTYAGKVYRGVCGMTLPDAFWQPNEHGVRGGIESAFMSTTSDRAVAMQYAASGGGVGIVFEMQQGMIDRGADISWASQYPHECEILLAPLTGLEVRSMRVEGSVLVVGVSLSVNLTALTIEQVRRHSSPHAAPLGRSQPVPALFESPPVYEGRSSPSATAYCKRCVTASSRIWITSSSPTRT
jgi:hypothetical protein